MKEINICVCGADSIKNGLCSECQELLKIKKCKNIMLIEKIRFDYNAKHGTYKTYGQFIEMVEAIYRRKRDIDYRRKKASVKKVRGNRRSY